jgi:hypothetical protein
MRTLGMAMLVGGLFGFFYCSSRLAGLEPVPASVAVGEYLQYEAGRWELGRYGAALAVLIGIVLSVFPKGR